MEREMITSKDGEVAIFSDEEGYHYQHRGSQPDAKIYRTASEAGLAAGLTVEEASGLSMGDWEEC